MVSFSELTYWQLPQVTGVFSVVNVVVHVNMGALKATKSHYIYTYTNSATLIWGTFSADLRHLAARLYSHLAACYRRHGYESAGQV